MRLKGKRIVITGATGGIGREAAKLFSENGASLVLSDLHEEACRELCAGLEGALPFAADVANASQVNELFNFADRELGGIDGLFHTAGIVSSYDLLSCTEEHFDQIMRVHLKGTFLCLQCAARHMKKEGGSIVLTASQRGILGAVGSIAYNAAKGGIVIMAKSAAMELGQFGIRVNALCPGATDTPMLRRDIDNNPDPSALEQRMLSGYPLGRFGKAVEMAYGAQYLISDEASFVTGTTLVIDGGNTAG